MVRTGQSGSGKTVLHSNLILNIYIYMGCFSRIHLDPVWAPVKKCIANDVGANPEKNASFDTFNSDELQKVLNLQHKINEL